MGFSKRIAAAACLAAWWILGPAVSGLPEAGAESVSVTVPACDTRYEWSGRWVPSEPKPVQKIGSREVTLPGTGIWVYKEVRVPPYTELRPKSVWVEKVVTVARSVVKKVTRWVRKVKSWLERTWWGKWVRRFASWVEPVTQWIRQTVWERVSRWVQTTVMEAVPVYHYEMRATWIPPRTETVYFTYVAYEPDLVKEMVPAGVVVVEKQMQVEAGGVPRWAVQEMFDRLEPCDTVPKRLAEIRQTWSEFTAGLAVYRHAAVDRLYRDQFLIFLDGLPEDEGYLLPGFASLAYGFGRGWEPWEYYTTPGANAAQYFRLGELAVQWGWGGGYPNPHRNLCGPLAVIAMVGEGIRPGLTRFRETEAGDVILKKGLTTGPGHLQSLFQKFEWVAGWESGPMEPEALAAELRRRKAVVVLVDISTATGLLTPQGGTAHWVGVLEVILTRNGQDAVRVYNPMVTGSNPVPATKLNQWVREIS